ncbi:MAG: NADPH-dependent FMN reductase [Propionibacteriaceae bacterium]
MKIGIIIGSVRQGRKAESVARWVREQAAGRTGVDYELIDLAEFELGILTDPVVPGAANRQYSDPRTIAWGAVIDGYDGFVFVTPEYNHSIPGAFKNAFDSIYPEWNHKAVTYVSYGADSGVRAVEHWRAVTANAFLQSTRGQVSCSTFSEFDADGGFQPDDRRTGELAGVLDQLEALARAVQTLRS